MERKLEVQTIRLAIKIYQQLKTKRTGVYTNDKLVFDERISKKPTASSWSSGNFCSVLAVTPLGLGRDATVVDASRCCFLLLLCRIPHRVLSSLSWSFLGYRLVSFSSPLYSRTGSLRLVLEVCSVFVCGLANSFSSFLRHTSHTLPFLTRCTSCCGW